MKHYLVVLTALLFLTTACASDRRDEIKTRAAPAAPQWTDAKPNIVGAYNRFGFALFDRLESATPTKNVVISPASAALALAMTANGAAGSTRLAILRTLELPNAEMGGFDAANADLISSLRRSTRAEPKRPLLFLGAIVRPTI